MAPALTNASAVVTVNINSLKPMEITAADVITFNQERYLIAVAAARSNKVTPTLLIYDLTKGDTIEEAIKIFEASDKHDPIYSLLLGGQNNGNPASSVNYIIKKDTEGNDAELRVFAHRTQSGFVIVDFPKKVASDD